MQVPAVRTTSRVVTWDSDIAPRVAGSGMVFQHRVCWPPSTLRTERPQARRASSESCRDSAGRGAIRFGRMQGRLEVARRNMGPEEALYGVGHLPLLLLHEGRRTASVGQLRELRSSSKAVRCAVLPSQLGKVCQSPNRNSWIHATSHILLYDAHIEPWHLRLAQRQYHLDTSPARMFWRTWLANGSTIADLDSSVSPMVCHQQDWAAFCYPANSLV